MLSRGVCAVSGANNPVVPDFIRDRWAQRCEAGSSRQRSRIKSGMTMKEMDSRNG